MRSRLLIIGLLLLVGATLVWSQDAGQEGGGSTRIIRGKSNKVKITHSTPGPTATPTATSTATPTPTNTPTPTPTFTPTATPTVTPTPTATFTPTATPTPGGVTAFVIPTLPAATVPTAMPAVTGITTNVDSCNTFQQALNNATLGDKIVVNSALSCIGPYTFPAKGAGTNWITVTTSATNLPAQGTRVSLADVSKMPTFTGDAFATPVFDFPQSSHHWRLVGLRVMANPTINSFNNITVLGGTTPANAPNNIIFDRMIIGGTGTASFARRGIFLAGNTVGVIDSYVYNFYDNNTDSQAILVADATGPYLIENNLLQAAGENLLTGGTCSPSVAMMPQDITIKRNYMHKPLSWKENDPSWDGILRVTKNILEIKVGLRVLIEGNVLDRNWADSQSGIPVVLTVRNQTGTCSFHEVSDVTMRYNKVLNTGRVFNMYGTDDTFPSQDSKRFYFHNNLFYLIDPVKWNTSSGQSLLLTGVLDTTFNHNTFILGSTVPTTGGGDIIFSCGVRLWDNFWSSNNLIAADGDFGGFAIFTDNDGNGTTALNTCAVAPYTVTANAWWNMPGGCATSPVGNSCLVGVANVGFTNATSCADSGDSGCVLQASSAFKAAGSDGADLGADIPGVLTNTAGVMVGP